MPNVTRSMDLPRPPAVAAAPRPSRGPQKKYPRDGASKLGVAKRAIVLVDIQRPCVHHLFDHVNGDHPHILVAMSKLAEKEVHYTWPVNVNLRVHENVTWEPRVVVIPELAGGDLVVCLPLHAVAG